MIREVFVHLYLLIRARLSENRVCPVLGLVLMRLKCLRRLKNNHLFFNVLEHFNYYNPKCLINVTSLSFILHLLTHILLSF